MRRFLLTILVGLLSYGASGATSLVVSESCTVRELTGTDDNTCPPMCVTCGCCARSVEPVAITVEKSTDIVVDGVTITSSSILEIDPHDILHVPKFTLF